VSGYYARYGPSEHSSLVPVAAKMTACGQNVLRDEACKAGTEVGESSLKRKHEDSNEGHERPQPVCGNGAAAVSEVADGGEFSDFVSHFRMQAERVGPETWMSTQQSTIDTKAVSFTSAQPLQTQTAWIARVTDEIILFADNTADLTRSDSR
jgi:hypothetical protein